MTALNPKNGQGDGAGFNRLRAAQAMRQQFATIVGRSHPSCDIYIDQVREYAGSQVVFYRCSHVHDRFEHARCAIFEWRNPTATKGKGEWVATNDIIVAQEK